MAPVIAGIRANLSRRHLPRSIYARWPIFLVLLIACRDVLVTGDHFNRWDLTVFICRRHRRVLLGPDCLLI